MSKEFSDNFYRPVVFQEIGRTVWPPSWLGHAPFAMWLVEALKPNIMVELGTHTGNSFAAFSQAAKFINYTPNFYAVDTWEGDPHAGLYGEEVFADVQSYFSTNFPTFTHLLRKTFNEALKDFKDGSIDLINIDGYHTYEATKENFDNWLPKMSSRGVVLIHDTNVYTADFGAWKFWEEIENKYPSLNFLHSHGLGVVVVGSEISDSLKALTKPEFRDELRGFFSMLGAAPVLKAETGRLETQLKAQEKNSQEAQALAERERINSETWMAFIQQHLGADLEAAKQKLESISQGNLEGLSYKLFVERSLGKTIDEAEKKLAAERLESLSFKNFIHGNIADDLETARKKLEELGKSNLEGIGFRVVVQRYAGETPEDAIRFFEDRKKMDLENESWKNQVTSKLGTTVEEASQKLDQLLECSEDMKSFGHKTVSFVNKKIKRPRTAQVINGRKL